MADCGDGAWPKPPYMKYLRTNFPRKTTCASTPLDDKLMIATVLGPLGEAVRDDLVGRG
jgi:hypothetical protein